MVVQEKGTRTLKDDLVLRWLVSGLEINVTGVQDQAQLLVSVHKM